MAKKLFTSIISGILICLSCLALAQKEGPGFKSAQMASGRVEEAWKKYNDTLSKYFAWQGVSYPCKDIYLRAFKSQNELELWGRDSANSVYKLIKTYRICAVPGVLGPKRSEGDRQMPEGFYFIDEFNARSDYYLSLLLNYPNFSDKSQSRNAKLGGEIYIHGGCVTVGCMPMTDEGIKELYTACLNAKLNGQENIPVHIYPTRLNKNGMSYLSRAYAGNTEKQQFWMNMKGTYDYFEQHHKLLPVMYTPDGRYAN